MKIKKGDNVIVTSGASRGKKGTVLQVFRDADKILIDGVNLKKKHSKKQTKGGQGQIVDVPRPIHVSNVMLVDPKGGKPTRTGMKMVGEKKVRIAQKSGQEIK